MINLKDKTVLVLGADGYIGWPLCNYLKELGALVVGVDNGAKREWELVTGSRPIARILPMTTRFERAQIGLSVTNVVSRRLYDIVDQFLPDVIVHLAEQPSAPLSMLSRQWAMTTQANNVLGTLNLMYACAHVATKHGIPVPHILKLGTMGEYGTPPCVIEEGYIDRGGYKFLFPKQPGSIYHLSKVHDSNNLEFACRAWGFRVTDINQGIVWGTETYEVPFASARRTAFHVDSVFGTVINRFVAQAAIGCPLTVYGNGSQTRGFIHLADTIKCMALAIQSPPEEGEFRVINQLTDTFSINALASVVVAVSGCRVEHIENPRVEAEDHTYEVVCKQMKEIGFTGDPRYLSHNAITNMINQLKALPGIKKPSTEAKIKGLPSIRWRTGGLDRDA